MMENRYAMIGFKPVNQPVAEENVTARGARERALRENLHDYMLFPRTDGNGQHRAYRVVDGTKVAEMDVREWVFKHMLKPGLSNGSEYGA